MVAHAKLLLLHHERFVEFHELDTKLAQVVRQSLEDSTTEGSTATATATATAASRRTPKAVAAMQSYLSTLIEELQTTPLPSSSSSSSSGCAAASMYQLDLVRQYIKSLIAGWKAEPKCNHCGAVSPKVKQDQYNKVFQKALSAKHQRINQAEDLVLTSALETLQSRRKRNQSNKTTATAAGTASTYYDSDDSEQSKTHPMVDDQAQEATSDDDDDDDDTNTSDWEEDMNDNDGLASPIKPTRKRKSTTNVTTTSDNSSSNNNKKTSTEQYYMHPGEVRAQCQLTWEHHGPLLTLVLFGTSQLPSSNSNGNRKRPQDSYHAFFVQAIAVPPSRFRPPMTTGGMTVEHGQNQYLSQLLTEHATVRQELFSPNGNERLAHTMWIQLQTSYNCFLDSSKDPSVAAQLGQTPNGIRQLLEKKEGIFRKHMMGKRVDSSCRSVISPDPYIGTNEIGIPLAFAKVLTYPTPVTEWNMTELRRLVERGPHQYPGARWVEVRGGQRIDLNKMNDVRRRAVGAMLLKEAGGGSGINNKPVIVGRQLRHGDTMLVNRQVRVPQHNLKCFDVLYVLYVAFGVVLVVWCP